MNTRSSVPHTISKKFPNMEDSILEPHQPRNTCYTGEPWAWFSLSLSGPVTGWASHSVWSSVPLPASSSSRSQWPPSRIWFWADAASLMIGKLPAEESQVQQREPLSLCFWHLCSFLSPLKCCISLRAHESWHVCKERHGWNSYALPYNKHVVNNLYLEYNLS